MAKRSAGSEMYSRSLLSSEAMRKSVERGINWRLVAYNGSDSNAKPLFGEEPCKLVMDILDVVANPGEESQMVKKYLSADNKFGFRREGGDEAFGGLHSFVYEKTEFIEGRHYVRAKDEVNELEEMVDKEGMFDIDGNLLAGKRYDEIGRYTPTESDIVKKVGDLLLVKEGSRQGIMRPDGSLFGGKSGMQEGEVSLKKFGKEICLYVKKDGQEGYISEKGKKLYGGLCAKLEEFMVGSELFGFARDGEGEDSKGQLYTRDGKKVYGEKYFSFHERKFMNKEVGILLQGYDEKGLIIVDREGHQHFGPHHQDPNKKGAEVKVVDGEDLARFLDEEDIYSFVRYWKFDNGMAYGGTHWKELPAGEEESGEPFTITIGTQFATVKKFEDKVEGQHKVGYFSKDPLRGQGNCELFGGLHLTQTRFQLWEGKPFIAFEDRIDGERKESFFHWKGHQTWGGYHPKGRIKKKFKQIDKEVDGQRERFAFLEVLTPKPAWKWALLLPYYLLGYGQSELYSMEGERFSSVRDVQKRYEIPENTDFKSITDSAAHMPIQTVEEATALLERHRTGGTQVHPSIEKLIEERRAKMEESENGEN